VNSTRRTAGIGWSRETLPAIALRIVPDDEIAGEQVKFFPVIVDERRRGVFTRDEAQEARTAAALARLVEIAREDLLLDAGRIARRRGQPSLRSTPKNSRCGLVMSYPLQKNW
jgi:hypothetical protein